MTDKDTNDVLDRRLGEAIDRLPSDIQPGRDLWPGIASRIKPRHQRWHYWPIAAAIGVAVLVGGGFLGARFSHPVTQQEASVGAPATTRLPSVIAMPDTSRALALATSVRRSTEFDPKTRAVLLRNLAIIESSLVNIQQAMKHDPDNPGLQRLLYQTYVSEAALMVTAQRIQLQTAAGVAA